MAINLETQSEHFSEVFSNDLVVDRSDGPIYIQPDVGILSDGMVRWNEIEGTKRSEKRNLFSQQIMASIVISAR